MKFFKLLALITLFLPSFTMAQTPSADDIVQKVERNLAPSNFKSTYQFKNFRTDGTISEYLVQFQVRDVNHSHGYFIKPEREKGREVLRVDDVIWTWVPSVGRAVRIADRDSFAGGDFSNADVLRVDWSARYNPKMMKELPKQWIIDLIAKGPDAPYAKMRLWIDRSNSQPVQQQFYDSNGTLLKRCLYGSPRKFGAIERPTRLVMENVITKQKSELTIEEFALLPKLPDSRFTVDHLGK